MQNYRHSDTH